MIFETDLDYSIINSNDEEKLVKYIEDNFVSPNTVYANGFSFKKTYNVMKVLCTKILQITPSPEQWVFLLADCERLLCEACAGAGKTTMAQLRSIKEKLTHGVAGINILSLAYNTHAVQDMKNRHSSIIHEINALKIPLLHFDRDICCHTFHSFCKAWVEDYLAEFGNYNKGNYILTDAERTEGMRMAITSYNRKNNTNVCITDVLIDSLLSLHSYINETLTLNDTDSWKLCPSMSDLSDLSLTVISGILDMYTRWKFLKHKMDFCDLVAHMYEICCRPAVMSRIRANYQVFIVDEYQDFTPSMLRILRIILEGDEKYGIAPFTNARLTCIGDGDQSIYGFRGTDSDNCVRFKEFFSSDGEMNRVTAMSQNRRCPETILSYARNVIQSNSKRIKKPIASIRDGGEVNVQYYSSVDEELNMLIQRIRKIPESEYKSTCVCYRNQSSSYLLGLKLAREKVPFRVARGHLILTDQFSSTLFDILNMLSYPTILSWAEKALYKVLPKSAFFNKKVIASLIEQQEGANKRIGNDVPFYSLNFPDEAYTITGFKEALDTLRRCCNLHKYNKPMSSYLPDLITLTRKYYLDWQMAKNKQITDDYVNYVSAWFSQDKDYDSFMKDYRVLLGDMTDTFANKIVLTTMHGLKGLEFKHVIIADLSDSIFPGTELTQVRDLSVQQKDILESEARRLFYVALTRAKETLTLYFDAKTPSRYIRFFTPNTGLAETYSKYIQEDGFRVADLAETENQSEVEDETAINDLLLDTSVFDNLVDSDEQAGINTVLTNFDSVSTTPTDFFEAALANEDNKKQQLERKVGKENMELLKDKPKQLSVLYTILERMQGGN